MSVALRQDIFNLSSFHTLIPNLDLSILSPRKTNSHVGVELPKVSGPPNTPGLKLTPRLGRVLKHTVLLSDLKTTSDTAVLTEVDAFLSMVRLSLSRSYMPRDIAVLIADAPEAIHFVRRQMPLLDDPRNGDIIERCIQHRHKRVIVIGDTGK